MTIYNIGTGIADITNPAIDLVMQGMADPDQKTTGVESRIYARAFIVQDSSSSKSVVIVIADILAGMEAVKSEVIQRLKSQFKSLYNDNSVLISGTHTHSAPGGFSHSKIYEHVIGGFNPHTFECIVSGIVTAIQKAHHNLAPGKIYVNTGIIADCGRQRSLFAYLNNPLSEREKYDSETNKEMLLLKFVRLDKTDELPLAVLNWYGIHPTDRGQKNTLINGDNKGYASFLFEQAMKTDYAAQETFIAAFANSSCGDVSGNVEFGVIPDGINDKEHMELHGNKQFDKAQELFATATEELQGNIDYRHTRVDMSQVKIEDQPGKRTYPGALGLSFTTSSTEDSIPRVKVGNLSFNSIQLKEGLVQGQLSAMERLAQAIITAALAIMFGRTKKSPEFIKGHSPKPIVLATGLMNPPITPNILPLQIIKIGNLALSAIPGEITTMAGRRLKETVVSELEDLGVNHLALATYSNDYSLYITTKQEYEKQHYEGASTLFGPYTLMAYQQEFRKLANALKNGLKVDLNQNPPVKSATVAKSITIRNLSDSAVNLKFFKQSDKLMIMPFIKLQVAQQSDWATPRLRDRVMVFPPNVEEAKMRLNNLKIIENIRVHNLVTIDQDGKASVSDYELPRC
ncbi:MAG: neutral/alkaline non-lysosomal ceramidase N-terminal domain-containing protein [Pleurocapsa sp. MO_192.B19]|nr:neutral/alkaline non-lysosomal ceramidase N-terminal domain-containing protein [Pleurocapsa sp. MO_192.B19]